MPILNLSIEVQLFAPRRIAAEAKAEAARIAAEAEAARIPEAEAARIAKDAKAARIADMAMITRCNTRIATMIATEAEAARRSAAESASAHHPVKKKGDREG